MDLYQMSMNLMVKLLVNMDHMYKVKEKKYIMHLLNI